MGWNPFVDEEAAKSPQEFGYMGAKWRAEKFLPPLGGEEVVLLELYHREQWFLMNYKSGEGIPDNRVQDWDNFRSIGMDEQDLGHVVSEESIYEQVYSKEW
jgi:hypothetical protein